MKVTGLIKKMGTRSRNRRVYSQQVMQEAGAIFRPDVAGIFSDQSLTPEEIIQKCKEAFDPEERAKWEKVWRERWKEEHIDDIKHNGDFWQL